MVLVTGANGTIGSEIVRQLVAAGVPVRAFVRSPEKASSLPQSGVEVVVGDFAHPTTLNPAIRGIDRVFLASFDGADQEELQGNLIDAAKGAGVAHIVRLSGMDADPDSSLILLRWHGVAERRLEASGLAFTHLRPNWFMQNFLSYAAGGVIRLPGGNGKVAFIDVRDIAAVTVKALTEPGHEGKAYTLTGPEALTHDEVAYRLSTATGQTFVYEDIPPEEFRQATITAGEPEWSADMVVELFEHVRADLAAEVTDTVERVTGRPPHSFADFGRDFASAFVTRY